MPSGKLCLFAALAIGAASISCTSETPMKDYRELGKTKGGEVVELYTLTNSKGIEATIMNYGGIVVSLKVPDRGGRFEDDDQKHD